MQIEVIKTFTVPVDRSTSISYPPGRYDVSDDLGRYAVREGHAREIEVPSDAPAGKSDAPQLTDEERLAAIVDAIGKLDPSGLTADGKPTVVALAQATGFPVTAAERDAALAAIAEKLPPPGNGGGAA